MSVFSDDPAEWQRLDWSLLQNSSVALYYSPEILATDVSWLASHRYSIRSLECMSWRSSRDFLLALAALLQFAEHFGATLDGFNDCVSDLEVPLEGGLALVFQEYQRVSVPFMPAAQAVLDILADNSRRFLLTGRRFVTLVHSSDPRIAFEPVGATPVMWNPQEWFDSKRGL